MRGWLADGAGRGRRAGGLSRRRRGMAVAGPWLAISRRAAAPETQILARESWRRAAYSWVRLMEVAGVAAWELASLGGRNSQPSYRQHASSTTNEVIALALLPVQNGADGGRRIYSSAQRWSTLITNRCDILHQTGLHTEPAAITRPCSSPTSSSTSSSSPRHSVCFPPRDPAGVDSIATHTPTNIAGD